MGFQEQLQGLGRFADAWRWWRDELASLLPSALRKHFSPEYGVLRIRQSANGFTFTLSGEAQQTDLGIVDLEHANNEELRSFGYQVTASQPVRPRVELLVADDFLLSREIFLPLAVESNLANILQFEVDKLTPYRKGEALIAYQPTGHHPELNKLSLQLYCAERKWLTGICNKLRLMDLAPSAVLPESLGQYATKDCVNFLPAEERMQPEPLWNAAAARAGLLTAGLAVLALALPAWYLEGKVESMQREIDEVKVQATRVAEKRGQVTGNQMAQRALVERKNQQPAKLQIIAELTRVIPDTTWVSRLRFFGDKLLIQGESSRASDLIELLEQSAYFSNVRFRSPITRNPRTSLEQYQIELEPIGAVNL